MPSRKRHRQPKPEPLAVLDSPVWNIDTPDAIPRLVEEIFSEGRYRPLIVVSSANDTERPRVNVDDLLAAVTDHANIAVLAAGETTWAFTHGVPDHFRSYGGGVRLCWPYATREDALDRHPVYITRTEDESTRTIERIQRTLRGKGYLPEPDAPEHRTPWQDETVSTEQDKVERLLADLSAAHERISTLSTENADLRKTVHGLTDQVSDLQQRLHHTNIFSDPDTQLRHEIELAWLRTYAETDRERYPLATYTFGPDFLDSVANIEGVERDKIVATCVDVVTRRAWEVNGRQARQFRSSPAAGSPYLVRSTDEAAAWRCNIQTATASARRLMWWEVPDGTIELAVVAIHDDIEMR
jgi:hypothetical protein